jgi:hypothetical protein
VLAQIAELDSSAATSIHATLIVIEEVMSVATHSKTRRAVRRRRRLARRSREAELRKARRPATRC